MSGIVRDRNWYVVDSRLRMENLEGSNNFGLVIIDGSGNHGITVNLGKEICTLIRETVISVHTKNIKYFSELFINSIETDCNCIRWIGATMINRIIKAMK